MDGVEVSVMGWVINTCRCQPMHPSLVCEEQSHVYQSRCVLASLTNFMVLTCVLPGVDTVQGIQKVEWLWG